MVFLKMWHLSRSLKDIQQGQEGEKEEGLEDAGIEPLSRPLYSCSPLSPLPGCGPSPEELPHSPFIPWSPVDFSVCGLWVPSPLPFFVYTSLLFSTPPLYSVGDATCSHYSHMRDRKQTNFLQFLILHPI